MNKFLIILRPILLITMLVYVNLRIDTLEKRIESLSNSLKGHVHVADDLLMEPKNKLQVRKANEYSVSNLIIDQNGVVVYRRVKGEGYKTKSVPDYEEDRYLIDDDGECQ